MRTPMVFTATEIATWPTSEEFKPGVWRPARCCSLSGFRLTVRARIAWRVFTGQYDALIWGEKSGEWSNQDCNYRDLTERGFVRAGKEKA